MKQTKKIEYIGKVNDDRFHHVLLHWGTIDCNVQYHTPGVETLGEGV